MSKKQPISEQEIQNAATEALAEELLSIQIELDQERSERQALERQVNDLRESVNTVTNSVNIAPPPPAPLERPIVTLPDGKKLRFKVGAFKTGGKVYLAADVVADPEHLATVLAKFPGLFEPA